jgi:hypothetical protein
MHVFADGQLDILRSVVPDECQFWLVDAMR